MNPDPRVVMESAALLGCFTPIKVGLAGETYGCGEYNYVGGSIPADPIDYKSPKKRIPHGYGLAIDKFSGNKCLYFLHGYFHNGELMYGQKVKVDEKSRSVKEGVFRAENGKPNFTSTNVY